MANAKVKLGKLFKDEMGALHGRLTILGLGSTNIISEQAKTFDGAPYLKLIADPLGDAYEIGAAFPKKKDGMDYYSVNLDSPILPAPINAALFPDKNNPDTFNLIWTRPEPKAVPAPSATGEIALANNQEGPSQKRGIFRKPAPAATL